MEDAATEVNSYNLRVGPNEEITPRWVEWSKLPLEQREADVHRVLTINEADTSTLVNNLVAERLQSRRRRVRQNDDHQKIRTVIVKERLRAKLAARKKALSEKQNDSRPAKTNAKKSRKRARKKKGQPSKASWSPQKVLGKSKRCHTPAKK